MKRNLRLAMSIAALAVVPAVFGQASTDTANTTLSVTYGPEAQFVSADANTNLTKVGTKFESFTGTTNFTYKIRTSQNTGIGSITVQVTNFSAGGPVLTDLTYACTAPAPGTACSAGTAVSNSAGTSVVGFNADAHSADTGDAGTTTWTLVDRTTIKTGTYTSTATYTISAT